VPNINVGQVNEADSALSVSPQKLVHVGIASEVDSAHFAVQSLAPAVETDAALPIEVVQSVSELFTPVFTAEGCPPKATVVKQSCEVVIVTPPAGETPPEVEVFDPDASSDLREFLADFDTPTHALGAGGSLVKRPDAVSPDYLVSYSLGPIALGDANSGPVNRVWKARADNTTNTVYVARANDANTAWESEVALFTYAGVASEIDLAFEQLARAVVCLEISGHLWLYWFDPLIPAFTLTDFGVGRNPRCLLDNPPDTTDSDVLVFYISDVADGLVYRQQRDRYGTEYSTPITGVTDKYLEEVFRSTDFRVVAVISTHNVVAGQYSLSRLESTLYPQILEPEGFRPSPDVISGILASIILEHALFDIDEFRANLLSIQSGTLAAIVIDHTLFDVDEFKAEVPSIQSGVLAVVVIEHTLFDIDKFKAELLSITGGTMLIVVIEHTLFDIDEFKCNLTSIVSGSLVAA